jgi:hypothetical protein
MNGQHDQSCGSLMLLPLLFRDHPNNKTIFPKTVQQPLIII